MAFNDLQSALSLLVCIGAVLYFFSKLYRARSLIYEKQRLGLPVAPGHSFLFGHLLFFNSALKKIPANAHYQNALGDIAREHFPAENLFYIDTWPVSGILLVNVSPEIASQVHADPHVSMQRPLLLPRWFQPISGGPNLFDLPESQWKPWRSVFSKGFNAEHVLSLVPDMVDETAVYCETLAGLAQKGEMFYLDPVTLRFTIDVIGKTILNARLGAQRGYNALADCMLNQIRWHQNNAETNPLEYLNLVRRAVHWRNGRRMDDYIGKELDKRYAEYKSDPESKRTKAIIDLVLQAYLSEGSATTKTTTTTTTKTTTTKSGKLDPKFRAFAICQIRLFVFLGHDSTSSTICYILYLLSTNPDTLAKTRTEHDELLGSNVAVVGALLKAQPHLANDLPYTTAVIKEALRLFPPGCSSRQGSPQTALTSDNGLRCPTDQAVIFTIHSEMHRNPAYWVKPDEFLPERWLLVDADHELSPVKGASRPFEIGPRNCIAQGYVMTELRIILACVVRRFDFAPAYEEWDRLNPGSGLRTFRGERAYQIEEGAAHPAEHFPCRVTVRS
ncbi:hypothetical protein MMC25_005536 [Agyrium rufum]|nr:hypothetical protein [Agyrium rufum]